MTPQEIQQKHFELYLAAFKKLCRVGSFVNDGRHFDRNDRGGKAEFLDTAETIAKDAMQFSETALAVFVNRWEEKPKPKLVVGMKFTMRDLPHTVTRVWKEGCEYCEDRKPMVKFTHSNKDFSFILNNLIPSDPVV